MPPYTLDLDRRTDALIELLGCPVRWSSKAYVMQMSRSLIIKCDNQNRPDLSQKIEDRLAKLTR